MKYLETAGTLAGFALVVFALCYFAAHVAIAAWGWYAP